MEYSLIEIIDKLVGSINPTGDHGVDEDRIKNLEKYIALSDSLFMNIVHIATSFRERKESSIRTLSDMAFENLKETHLLLQEIFSDTEANHG